MGRTGLALLLVCATSCMVWSQSMEGLMALHGGLAGCRGEECKTISDSLTRALEVHLEDARNRPVDGGISEFMATVQSADGRLRVMTWNWPHEDRTSSYAGLVAFRKGPDEDIGFTRLHDPSSADRPDDNHILKPEEWAGALYYAMVPDAVDKDIWLLLGWDDADAQVTRKIIEPIQMRTKGPRFGAGVLQSATGMQRRHVLEYADDVQASLRHQPGVKGKQGHAERVVFDHLAPREPHLTGITAYYGPDMTFDAYEPGKKGVPWVLREKVDAIQAQPDDRPFNDPRSRNSPRNRR